MRSDRYTAFQREWTDGFAGDCVETVVVSDESGLVIGHFRCWVDPTVVDEWHPERDGCCGIWWEKDRPAGWRKVHASKQEQVLDWALDTLSYILARLAAEKSRPSGDL